MTSISDENPKMVPILEKYVNQVQIMKGLSSQSEDQEVHN